MAGRLCSALLWRLLLLLLAQVSLLPVNSEHSGKCQDLSNQYYDTNAGQCCRFCQPGFRVSHYCNENMDTQCEACEEDTFTNSSNSARRCLGCAPKCKKGLVEIQQCTRTQDRRCWCPPHEFCKVMVFGTCVQCKPYQQCPKGYGVAKPGTEKSNVECSPCEPGMFSDVESHSATCRLHRTCEFELLPGNSTNDAVCKNVTPVISPRPTVKGKETSPPQLLVASSPDVNVNAMQQTPPENIAYIIGGLTTGLFIMVGVIVAVSCIVSRRKALPCKQLFGGEKQLFPSIGNGSHKWPQVSSAAKREEENLLKISPSSSGSLDHPPVLDKSSGISDLEDSRTEVEGSQQRSLPLNSCVYHCRANSKQTGSGGTHVNFSCVVNVCSSDHSLQLLSPTSSADEDALVGEDVPLSKEEIPIQRASERQSAIEVEEDSMDTLTYEEGKPVPLSVQDVGMKTR